MFFFLTKKFTNVVASSLSDHDMLIAVRKINACKLPPRTIECRNYAKYNPSAFCDDLEISRGMLF